MHTDVIANPSDCGLRPTCPKREQIKMLVEDIDDQELDKVINELTLLQHKREQKQRLKEWTEALKPLREYARKYGITLRNEEDYKCIFDDEFDSIFFLETGTIDFW